MELNATFIFAAISFVIFVFLMNIILYKPIAKIVNEREEYYAENAKIISSNEKQIDDLTTEKKEKIAKAKTDSREQISYFQNNAQEKKADIIKSCKEELVSQVRINAENLHSEKLSIQNDIEKNSDEISDIILQKLLKGENNVGT